MMQAPRLTATLLLSGVLIGYAGKVMLAWERLTPAFLGGMTPEPNDSTVIFLIGGLITIWSAPKLRQQIICCGLALLGIWFMDSLLPRTF